MSVRPPAAQALQLLGQPLVEGTVVEQAGQRVAGGAAAQVLVHLGVSQCQRGLAGDRLAEVDVPPRPAARGAVVGQLDHAHRLVVDAERQGDPAPPVPLNQHVDHVRVEVGRGQPLLDVAGAGAQEHPQPGKVGELVDLAPLLLGDAAFAVADRRRLEGVLVLQPDRDGHLVGPLQRQGQLAGERVHHLRERQRVRERDRHPMQHLQLAAVAVVPAHAATRSVRLPSALASRSARSARATRRIALRSSAARVAQPIESDRCARRCASPISRRAAA